jgi:hypothetical protein
MHIDSLNDPVIVIKYKNGMPFEAHPKSGLF